MKVGFIGTGPMGLPMVQRLLDANIELVAYNLLRNWNPRAAGVAIAEHHDAIRGCECVILMLTDASAIQSVLLSDTSRQHLGRTVIQMGITPTESRAISDEIVAAGGDYLDTSSG